MATFSTNSNYKFHFINHTNGSFSYDLGPLDQPGKVGSVGPGQQGDSPSFDAQGSIEKGNVVVLGIRGDNNPGFRFWSGSGNQYINLLGGNGYTVTGDSSEISELTGNGFRVTVDGGGVKNPGVYDINIQVYKA
jgi:hypothetical protein